MGDRAGRASSARPAGNPSTVMRRPIRQTVCRWKREDVLQQRHALGQITAIGKEARERLGRRDDDQLADMEDACGRTA